MYYWSFTPENKKNLIPRVIVYLELTTAPLILWTKTMDDGNMKKSVTHGSSGRNWRRVDQTCLDGTRWERVSIGEWTALDGRGIHGQLDSLDFHPHFDGSPFRGKGRFRSGEPLLDSSSIRYNMQLQFKSHHCLSDSSGDLVSW